MVDIELETVKTVGQQSQQKQPGVDDRDDEDDQNNRKHPASNEHESQHFLPSTSQSPPSDHAESSISVHNVETNSQNEDEDLITVPAAKLEQWLQLGIRILRESRQRPRTAGSDPEHEALDNDPEHPNQQNFRISPPPNIMSGPRVYAKGPQKATSDLDFLPIDESFPHFTADQRGLVSKFLKRAHENPVDITFVQRRDLGGHIDTYGLVGPGRRPSNTEKFDQAFERVWDMYYVRLFQYVEEFELNLIKERFRNRSYALVPHQLTQVRICCAQILSRTLPDNWTVKVVLEYCYSTKVLIRNPKVEEPMYLKRQITMVSQALHLFNDYLSLPNELPQTFVHSLVGSMETEKRFLSWLATIEIEVALGLRLHELMIISRFLCKESLPSAISGSARETLMINDLNAESLKKIGGLELVWTNVLEEHLHLDLRKKCLFLAWTNISVPFWDKSSSKNFRQACMVEWDAINVTSVPQPISRADISATWTMLHGNLTNPKKIYEDISISRISYPLWGRTRKLVAVEEYSKLKEYHNPINKGIKNAIRHKAEIHYTTFGPFENRVRILREYMDNQKPRGFRQLWRDNRDSSNYYTFWGVIIFGTVSVFLAMASLAVSIAQTYASFKALG